MIFVLYYDIISKNCYTSCMLLVANEKNQFLVYFLVGGGVGVLRRAVVCIWYIRMRDEVILASVTKLYVPLM